MMENIRLAEVYAFRGMNDAAVATLQSYREAFEPGDETLLSQIWWHRQEMSVSPFLMPLHSDPRWETLMAEPG